jgi:uncharacterized protein YndB with AHSA1/START domain
MGDKIIEVERWIDAPPEVVFDAVHDAASWPDWSAMDKYECERPGFPDPDGVGTIRNFHHGRNLSREEVVVSDAPGHFAYTLLSGLPIEGYRADVRLRPERGGTALQWRSTFRPKVPGTGWIYRFALGRFIRQIVGQLAAHTEVPRRVS